MSKAKKLLSLYHQGLEYQKQLDAVLMSEKFLTAKELGAFYEVKSGAVYRLENNTEEFKQALYDLTDNQEL